MFPETSIVLSQPAPHSLFCSSYQYMIVSILRLEVLQTRWYCTPINKVICWQDSNETVLWMSNVLQYVKTQRIYRRKYWHIELVRTNDKNLRTGAAILTIMETCHWICGLGQQILGKFLDIWLWINRRSGQDTGARRTSCNLYHGTIQSKLLSPMYSIQNSDDEEYTQSQEDHEAVTS